MVHASCLDLVRSKLLSGCPKLLMPQDCGLWVASLVEDSFPSTFLCTIGPYLDLTTLDESTIIFCMANSWSSGKVFLTFMGGSFTSHDQLRASGHV